MCQQHCFNLHFSLQNRPQTLAPPSQPRETYGIAGERPAGCGAVVLQLACCFRRPLCGLRLANTAEIGQGSARVGLQGCPAGLGTRAARPPATQLAVRPF